MYYEPLEKWIWLDEKAYPENQKSVVSCMADSSTCKADKYTVAKFNKTYCIKKSIKTIDIRTSGDTFFRLSLNGIQIASGPSSAGGDFLTNNLARPQQYAYNIKLSNDDIHMLDGILDFSAIVRMAPVKAFEYSQGHGGFFMTAHVYYEDGEKTVLTTDESWMAIYMPAYVSSSEYNALLKDHSPVNTKRIQNIWHCLDSYIPPMSETLIIPDGGKIVLRRDEEKEYNLKLDMIYTGYPYIKIKSNGTVNVVYKTSEMGEPSAEERYVFNGDDCYIGMAMKSAMNISVYVKNESTDDVQITVGFIASCFPVDSLASTHTSDSDLNLVCEVCTHTLKYCRQTIHLDSGSHCEPLACTGDYYIQSHMTAFTFGDMRLSEFDVMRTAQLLRYNDGRMFHTTYSLIWVQMLWDVYVYTGNCSLLKICEEALILLLERFATYIGDNGLIETPPDYMFVDWLIPDGISMHHPPKALGQTCLNLFYYGALNTAAKIWGVLGCRTISELQKIKSDRLHESIEKNLYDSEKGVFFEGLNTMTPDSLVSLYMPMNVGKRYYMMHANILAAYFGFFDKAKNAKILDTILSNESFGVVQPYFSHFLLDAVYRNGLRDKYTYKILCGWKEAVKNCPYGLAEGFYKPEPTYSFDHSHAWGGTVVYALPLALTGIEIIEPAYKKIRLNPSLLGLDSANAQIPTPLGIICVNQKKGCSPVIKIPDGIELIAN